MRGPLNEKLFRKMSHAPRPCVAARGRPEPTVVQVQGIAEQSATNTPRSVAAYRVLGTSGSRTRSFTGMLGRSVAARAEQLLVEQLTSFQVKPLSVVLKMWPSGS